MRLWDNPLLIALARQRLRPRRLVPALVVALIVAVSALLSTIVRRPTPDWKELAWEALYAAGVVLYFLGGARVYLTVRADADSGLLDFHRASPTSPWSNAVAYLLGPPAQEYLVAAVFCALVPFGILAKDVGWDALVLPIVLFLSAALWHALLVLLGLLGPRGGGAAVGAALALLNLVGMAWVLDGKSVTLAGLLTPIPAFDSALRHRFPIPSLSVFGLYLPAALLTLIVQASIGSFLFWGAARRLRSGSASILPRFGMVAGFSWVLFLGVGLRWRDLVHAATSLSPTVGVEGTIERMLGTTTALAALLLLLSVPTFLQSKRALHRARHQGRTGPRPWEDGGNIWAMVLAFWALSLLGIAAEAAAVRPELVLPDVALATVLAALSIGAALAFVGGAAEYLVFAWRGAGVAGALLIAAVILGLPLLIGGIGQTAHLSPERVSVLMAPSPLYMVDIAFSTLGTAWGHPWRLVVPLWTEVGAIAFTTGLAALLGVSAHLARRA